MKKKILFMLLPALMAISAGTALPTAVFASEGNSENTKELFNPDSAGVDHTWGQFENPEATWDKASQTLTIEIKQQGEWQWANQVFLSTGITTLDTSKEYQFSFTGTASTDDCGGVTFMAFDSNTLVSSYQNLPFTTTPYNYVSEWATPLEASTNGYLVFDFGWDAPQTVTITNISIKERSKVYTIVGQAAFMGSDWNPTDTENDMTDMGNGTFQLVKENVTLSAGTYEYNAVVGHAYGTGDWPENGGHQSFTIDEDATYTITFNYTPATPCLTADVVKTPTTYSYTTYENWQIKYGNEWEWSDNMEKVEDGLYKIEILWEGTGFNVKSDENPIKKDWFETTEVIIGDEVIAPVIVDVYLRVIDDETLKIGIGVEPSAPHVHAIKTTYAKVEAKCEEAGHEAYYECDCGKCFSNQALTQEIENLGTWLGENGDGYIAPIGHDIDKVNGTPATKGTDGFKDAYKCNNCGKYFEDEAGTKLIGDEAAYNAWKLAEGKIPALDSQKENGLSGGAIAGIVIGSVFGLLIIAFVVLYILWKRKNFNVPILSKVLTPAFRFINKLFFKTELNDVEAKEAENKSMKE